MSKGSTFFTVMVVGNNPYDLMSKYDSNLKVNKYIKYYKKDAKKYLENSIEILNEILKNHEKFDLTTFQIDFFKDKIQSLKSKKYNDYYNEISKDLILDADGNAWCDINPNGKWQTFNLGSNFSIPLKLKDGKESNTALKKDIDWNKMHMVNTEVYQLAWDLYHKIKKPQNAEEELILHNMSNQQNYFNKFNSIDEYITYNCAYWNYAYLDKNGWVDIDDVKDSNKWISEFYEKFVLPIKDSELITIFECSKDKQD